VPTGFVALVPAVSGVTIAPGASAIHCGKRLDGFFSAIFTVAGSGVSIASMLA